MKKRGVISYSLPLLLILLLVSGSMGFTLMHHTCSSCGVDHGTLFLTGSGSASAGACSCHAVYEDHSGHPAGDPGSCCNKPARSAEELTGESGNCCSLLAEGITGDQAGICSHPALPATHDELVFTNDCCSHQSIYLATTDLVPFKLHPRIMPQLKAAAAMAEPESRPSGTTCPGITEKPFHLSRDLTTVYCTYRS